MTTERTQAEVEALLADNSSGAIGPEDLRDALASHEGYGAILLSAAGGAASPHPTVSGVGSGSYSSCHVFDTVTAQSSDVNTGGVVAACSLGVSHGITVTTAGIYRVAFWASIAVTSSGRTLHFRPHVDGSPGPVEVLRYVGNNDVGVVAFNGIIPYTAGQVVDMRVKVDAGSTDILFYAAGLNLFRVG